jgi:hypothetical protein
MATKAQVERAILEREGFRVEFELFGGKREALPPYDYPVMAPQRWKVSDWKNARLEAYRVLVKRATVYRGDGAPIDRDLRTWESTRHVLRGRLRTTEADIRRWGKDK